MGGGEAREELFQVVVGLYLSRVKIGDVVGLGLGLTPRRTDFAWLARLKRQIEEIFNTHALGLADGAKYTIVDEASF